MKQKRVQESVFIGYVLQHIKQQDHIKSPAKLLVPLMDVVTADAADPAHVVLQAIFVQIKSRHRLPIFVFDLPLQQSVATAYLRNFRSSTQYTVRDALENFKAAAYPEVIRGCNLKIAIGHAYFGGRG